jgi:hypothetical protein
MFKLSVKRWWNGDEVRDRLIAGHRAGVRALEFHRTEPGEAGISSGSTDGCHVPMTAGITPGRR